MRLGQVELLAGRVSSYCETTEGGDGASAWCRRRAGVVAV